MYIQARFGSYRSIEVTKTDWNCTRKSIFTCFAQTSDRLPRLTQTYPIMTGYTLYALCLKKYQKEKKSNSIENLFINFSYKKDHNISSYRRLQDQFSSL
ncbi:hypothetical protein TNCV_3799101 [Trichonephila clavipes]|nr:hypothetical protein TNCV_3799101 [Trichonephila clavipes]